MEGLPAPASMAAAELPKTKADRSAADQLARKEAKAKVKATKAKAARAAAKAKAKEAAAAGAGAAAGTTLPKKTKAKAARATTAKAKAKEAAAGGDGGGWVRYTAAGEAQPKEGWWRLLAQGEAVERGSEVTMNMSTGQSWVKYSGPGDPPERGDAAGAGAAAGTPLPKKHPSSVDAPRDAQTATPSTPIPVVPERQRKGGADEDLPRAHKANPDAWVRHNLKKHTGLFARVITVDDDGKKTMHPEYDFAAIKHPVCDSEDCQLDCCANSRALGGLPGSDGRRAHEAWSREQVRVHYDKGGHKGEDAYLLYGISTRVRRHVDGDDAAHPFRRKKLDIADGLHVDAVRNGCAYCNTCAGVPPADRKHQFKPSGLKCCPRWDEGQKYIDDHPSTAMVYTINGVNHNGPIVLVSRSYWQSLYQCGGKKLRRLGKCRVASGPTEHQGKSGVAGGHNKPAPNVLLLLLTVLLSQPRENSHYGKFESSKKTE
jgi:hypothetical protein